MNALYYGDNLSVLRESIPTETVDLIYLDPPFNSQANYNVLFKAPTGEQSNTTVFFGDEFTLKLFRQLEAGENPDVEINDFLWAHGYRHVPEPLGSLWVQRILPVFIDSAASSPSKLSTSCTSR